MSKCNKKSEGKGSFWGSSSTTIASTSILAYEMMMGAADKISSGPLPELEFISKPTDAPKSMRDIYKVVKEHKPPAKLPVTDTGDWPYNKMDVDLAEKIMADLTKPSPLLKYLQGDNGKEPINSTQYYTNYKIGLDMAANNPAKLDIIEDIKEEDE